jgi:peptide chain release factor subunit 1
MTHKYLEALLSRREHPVRSILSVYLDVDESKAINLNRGFERKLKDITASIRKTITDVAETERFTLAVTRLSDFVSVHDVHAHTLAMFFDTTDSFFWHEELNVAMESQARWDRELFLQPLIGALDEFEKYGIILLDRARMRLFLMALGDIKEISDKNFSGKAVQHFKTVGMDHLGSASHAQEKADEKVRGNLRRYIKEIDALVQAERVEHLILAGTPEMTAELLHLLPKRLALLVTGSLVVSFDASPVEVRNAACALAEKHEREVESITVRELLTAAAKNEKAVVGLGRTLNAVNHGRVWQLVYSAGFRLPGFECAKCSALVTIQRDACAYCGGELQPVSDLIERAVEHAIRRGARIEVVKDEAAHALNVKGGIAAFLKARTASMNA